MPRTVTLGFTHVDVFARAPLSGNGLTVFLLDAPLDAVAMQRITQEMRQFESIFLRRLPGALRFQARIFTMEEEVGFAGHPALGAAAALHQRFAPRREAATVELQLGARAVPVVSRRAGEGYLAEMDQGAPEFGAPITGARAQALLAAHDLAPADLAPGFPLQMVSTGLPYLIIPVTSALARARIVARDLTARLAEVGARFTYVLDVEGREGRTWDNDGRVEDIATGSAAGPAAAYLVAHGAARRDEAVTIHQGRFVGRPSRLETRVGATVKVGGPVAMVGRGVLELPAAELRTAFTHTGR